MSTKIEWTRVPDGKGGFKKGETWNPVVGCTKVSAGCENCYAIGVAHRGMSQQHIGLTRMTEHHGPNWTGIVRMVPHMLEHPLRWKKPRGVFVNSMSDLFHEELVGYEVEVRERTFGWTVHEVGERKAIAPPGRKAGDPMGFDSKGQAEAFAASIRARHEAGRRFIAAVFGVMAATPQHTYQILTKRPEKAREWFKWLDTHTTDGKSMAREIVLSQAWAGAQSYNDQRLRIKRDIDGPWPLPNVWIGTSVEDQATADLRIPELLKVPAAVRFLSVEPLLGPVQLVPSPGDDGWDWAIIGGESGHGARPMHPDWARSLRDQCVAANKPFFFKQWGEWAPLVGALDSVDDDPENSKIRHREWLGDRWSNDFYPQWCDWEDGNYDPEKCVAKVGKKAAGRLLDGRTWDEYPQV